MSRWICVDDIGVEIGGGYIDIDAESFMNAPTIDICFCSECRYFYTEERFGETVHFCKHFNDVCGYWAKINADDFCSYGERKESE